LAAASLASETVWRTPPMSWETYEKKVRQMGGGAFANSEGP
jgi:hypothetical protein